MGNNCSMDIAVKLSEIFLLIYLEMSGGYCSTLQMYLILLNYTLKNGEDDQICPFVYFNTKIVRYISGRRDEVI